MAPGSETIGRDSTHFSNDSRLVASNFQSALKPASMPDVWLSSMRSVTLALSLGTSLKNLGSGSSRSSFLRSCSLSSAAAVNCLLTEAQSHCASRPIGRLAAASCRP